MVTELTERDYELIEVALESAASATAFSLGANDDMGSLNREYRMALARVQAVRSGQTACAACGRVGKKGFEPHPQSGELVCTAKNACAGRIART